MSDESPLSRTQALMGLLGSSFEEGDTTKYSRSDILRALATPMAGTAVAFPLLVMSGAPSWALVGDASAFALTVALYLGFFCYCFVMRPDALRSEKFELTKYAINQQLYGDNTRGLIEASPIKAVSSGPAQSNASAGES